MKVRTDPHNFAHGDIFKLLLVWPTVQNPKITALHADFNITDLHQLIFTFEVDFILPRYTMFLYSQTSLSVCQITLMSLGQCYLTIHISHWFCFYIYSLISSVYYYISLSLILTLAYHACRHVLCLLSCCNDSITVQHLPQTSKPPSDTSTSHSWHFTLTSPAKTWQPSTYPGGWIYETNVWTKLGSPR